MSRMKYISLAVLSIQTASHVVITRYSRAQQSNEGPYLASTAVAVVEILKLIICILVLFSENGYRIDLTFRNINNEVVRKPKETCKLVVPAGIYVIQNNLLFVALSNLDSATYQVSYQLKILTTAMFSVVLLGKRLQWVQWVSLVLLTAGVALVQLAKVDMTETGPAQGNPMVGMLAVLAASCTSGFSGVYFEKILKGSNQSLWIRNIQLAIFGVLISLGSIIVYDGAAVQEKGFLQGYTTATWLVIILGVLSGLTVALVVKYADNILKGFAVSISILISTFISWYFLNDFTPSLGFFAGALLVITATFLYGLDLTKKKRK